MQQLPDPVDFFERKDAKDAKWLASRPVCEICRNHIQEEPREITLAGIDFQVCEKCWRQWKEIKEEKEEVIMKYRIIYEIGYRQAAFDFQTMEEAGNFAKTLLTHQAKLDMEVEPEKNVRLEVVEVDG